MAGICADFAVIFRSSIFVPHNDCDGSSERFPFKHARQNFAAVFLFALRCKLALARPAAVELLLNVRIGNLDARRTTIDHYTDAAAM